MSEKIKVLMVDDEERFRATTKKILKKRGFETIVAASGEEAIERMEENPDVVILDINMPGMDGHQALKELKRISPETPVIMLTGHGTKPSASQALTEDAFDYLNKPCEIDLLTSRIMDAYRHGKKEGPLEENKVRDVMIPLEYYTILDPEATIKDAIEKLKESFTSILSTSRIMETGHRSVLVIDRKGEVRGILAIIDLIRWIMPAYLSAPKPSMADSIQYSPMFWRGMFSRQVKELAQKKIKEVMSPAPRTIDEDSNLMEAAYIMLKNQVRRLAVIREGKVAGMIREQDLFFEMERILTERQ
jgi:DNA-binding response OmpR family regulator